MVIKLISGRVSIIQINSPTQFTRIPKCHIVNIMECNNSYSFSTNSNIIKASKRYNKLKSRNRQESPFSMKTNPKFRNGPQWQIWRKSHLLLHFRMAIWLINCIQIKSYKKCTATCWRTSGWIMAVQILIKISQSVWIYRVTITHSPLRECSWIKYMAAQVTHF